MVEIQKPESASGESVRGGGSSMSPATILVGAVVLGMLAYALDHGIYVGGARYVMGYGGGGNDMDYIQKRCRYLFVTGVSEIDAHDGKVSAPRAITDKAALEEALKKPDNGYCRLFGE